MAGVATSFDQSSDETLFNATKIKSIKQLAELAELKSIPSCYTYNTDPINHENAGSDSQDAIPIIDFSLLASGDADQRSKVVRDLGKACQEWGFFMVVNHGVPESMIKSVIEGMNEFFDLLEEDKAEFKGNHVLDPIRYGTSFNQNVEKVFFWRDFLKVFVYPEFHFPNKPAGLSELVREYCKRTRELARELLRGISESLGQEQEYIENKLDIKSGLQTFIGNLYPPCPQPELAMGMPPHSDHGLLTLLIQNGVSGLQLLHNGKWVDADALPNSFLVNTGDHLEILSNGKYKSVTHRAVVNGKVTRNSIAVVQAPPLDKIVGPGEELLNGKNDCPRYVPMRYRDYLELQQGNRLDGKTCLDRVKIPRD